MIIIYLFCAFFTLLYIQRCWARLTWARAIERKSLIFFIKFVVLSLGSGPEPSLLEVDALPLDECTRTRCVWSASCVWMSARAHAVCGVQAVCESVQAVCG